MNSIKQETFLQRWREIKGETTPTLRVEHSLQIILGNKTREG